jgi:hypothetical protein
MLGGLLDCCSLAPSTEPNFDSLLAALGEALWDNVSLGALALAQDGSGRE